MKKIHISRRRQFEASIFFNKWEFVGTEGEYACYIEAKKEKVVGHMDIIKTMDVYKHKTLWGKQFRNWLNRLFR